MMDSSARPRIPKWVTLILIGIWMLLVFLSLTLIGIRSRYYSESAKIDGFSVCNISDTKSGSNVKVTVCGNLTTDAVAILKIYIHQLPEKTLVARNDVGDEFTGGYFSRILILPVDSQPGKYEVVVYFQREIIVTKEFDLK